MFQFGGKKQIGVVENFSKGLVSETEYNPEGEDRDGRYA
jgi:hypothetical protein